MAGKIYEQNAITPAQDAVLGMVAPGSSVLEVGCAIGFVTRILTEQMGCKVTAVEIDEYQASQAKPYAAHMIVGDIEDPLTWQRIAGEFDYVVFGDVLEHLKDPWEALRRAKRVLSADGCVLCSIPNVAYYRIRLKLLLGKFEYKQFGILDDTHLRFFTSHTARELFVRAGYRVCEFRAVNFRHWEGKLLPLSTGAFATQFVIKAKPEARAGDLPEDNERPKVG